MARPIATVTWTDKKGEENARECYNTKSLNFVVNQLKAKNLMFFICMTSVDAPIHFEAPRHMGNPIPFVNSHSLYSGDLKTGTTP